MGSRRRVGSRDLGRLPLTRRSIKPKPSPPLDAWQLAPGLTYAKGNRLVAIQPKGKLFSLLLVHLTDDGLPAEQVPGHDHALQPPVGTLTEAMERAAVLLGFGGEWVTSAMLVRIRLPSHLMGVEKLLPTDRVTLITLTSSIRPGFGPSRWVGSALETPADHIGSATVFDEHRHAIIGTWTDLHQAMAESMLFQWASEEACDCKEIGGEKAMGGTK